MLQKSLRRAIRYNGFVERAQQIARMSPKLSLEQIGLELDISPKDILIDCGANVGDVSSAFARTGATVYAFEPNQLCFATLTRRFSSTPNVKLFNQGVMDRACQLQLSAPSADGQFDELDCTVAGSFLRDAGGPATEVACIDLSEFIFSLPSGVRVLKLDIEGSEIAVINRLIDAGSIELIDLVLVETHEKQMPELAEPTNALRKRIADGGMESKFRLDWL